MSSSAEFEKAAQEIISQVFRAIELALPAAQEEKNTEVNSNGTVSAKFVASIIATKLESEIVYERHVKVQMKTRTSYVTKDQIQELGLIQHFPTMLSPQMSIENTERAGHLMASGCWIPGYGYNPVNWVCAPTQYRWVRQEKYSFADQMPAKRFQLSSEEDLKEIPVGVSFLEDIDRDMVMEETYHRFSGTAERSSPVVTQKENRVLTQRRTAVFFITRPEKLGTQRSAGTEQPAAPSPVTASPGR